MDTNTFMPDYSRIKRRVISGLILEIVIFLIVSGFCLALVIREVMIGNDQPDLLPIHILSIISAFLFARIVLSVISISDGFNSLIKSISIEEDGFTVNGVKYDSYLDPDEMKGIGLDFRCSLFPISIWSHGVNFIFLSSGSSGRQIQRKVWTGPIKDKDAKKLRQDILGFLKPSFDKINDKHYEMVKERISSKPIKVVVNKKKSNGIMVMIPIFYAFIIVNFIFNGFRAGFHDLLGMFFLFMALVLTVFLIRYVIVEKRCFKMLVNEIELSETALRTDNEVYSLSDTDIDMFYTSAKPDDCDTGLRSEPRSKEAPDGIFLILRNKENCRRYWLGDKRDPNVSAALELLKCAKRMQKESNC